MKKKILVLALISILVISGCIEHTPQDRCMSYCYDYECINTTPYTNCLFGRYVCTTYQPASDGCQQYCYYECKPK